MHSISDNHIKYLAYFLAALPIAALGYFIYSCSVDIPFWDQFLFPLRLEAMQAHRLSLFTIAWWQQNEHRLFFPFIIMAGLARFTGWNIIAETWLIFILALCSFVLFCSLFLKAISNEWQSFAIPAAAFLFFSLSQSENWLWGLQIQVFLMIFAFLLAILLATKEKFTAWHISGALLSALISSYSYADGFITWPVIIFLLLLRPSLSWRERLLYCAITAICFGLALHLYLQHYFKPPDHPTLAVALDHPGRYIRYVYRFLGHAIADPVYSRMAGATGLILFAAGSVLIFVKNLAGRNNLLSLMALGLFAIGSSLLIGFGRVGFDSSQALSSRYITISDFLWLANFSFIYIISGHYIKIKYFRWLSPLLCALLIYLLFPNYQDGWIAGEAHSNRLAMVKSTILASYPDVKDETLREIHPDPNKLRGWLKFLADNKLSLFRNYNAPVF